MKSVVPVVMAGILGIYGMIIAVQMDDKINIIGLDSKNNIPMFSHYVF